MNASDSDPAAKSDVNIFFRLSALAVAAFIFTILALVAAMFGNPQAPPARLLKAYGGIMIAAEVGVILFTAFVAMAVDRIRSLRIAAAAESAEQQAQPTASIEDPAS